jgi:hypothetical protein
MHNRIVRTTVLAGFAAAAAFAGLAIHAAGVAFGATGGNANDAFDAGLNAGRGYSPGFSLIVLLAVAGAGVLSMTAYHLSHGHRTAARVRVRSAQSGRDLEGLRPNDRRRD